MSESESRPFSASCPIAAWVNVLLIEPRLNFVSVRFGTANDAVGHAVRLVEERRAVLRDQDDSGERSGLGELAQVRVGGRGDLGVRALARLAGRIGALGLLEAQPADSVGRGRIELQADLEPVARVLRAREEGRPVVASGEHLLEIERPDLLRHAGQALRPLVEGGFLESRLGEVRRDERANRVGRSGLEGLQQRLDPPAGGSVGRRGPLPGSRGGRRGEAQTQKDREGRRVAKSHASVYAPAPAEVTLPAGSYAFIFARMSWIRFFWTGSVVMDIALV